MIVGNGVLNKNLSGVLTNVFSGTYRIGSTLSGNFDTLKTQWNDNMTTGETEGWGLLNAVANVGLQVAGNLAAIYALGNGDVGLSLTDKTLGKTDNGRA